MLTGIDNNQKFLDRNKSASAGSSGAFEKEREALARVGGFFAVTQKTPSDTIADFFSYISSFYMVSNHS